MSWHSTAKAFALQFIFYMPRKPSQKAHSEILPRYGCKGEGSAFRSTWVKGVLCDTVSLITAFKQMLMVVDSHIYISYKILFMWSTFESFDWSVIQRVKQLGRCFDNSAMIRFPTIHLTQNVTPELSSEASPESTVNWLLWTLLLCQITLMWHLTCNLKSL